MHLTILLSAHTVLNPQFLSQLSRPLIKRLLPFALAIVPVYSFSIWINKLSSLKIRFVAPESNTSSQAELLLVLWKNKKYSSYSSFGSPTKLYDPIGLFWLNFLLWFIKIRFLVSVFTKLKDVTLLITFKTLYCMPPCLLCFCFF